jgi:hypothetical protein
MGYVALEDGKTGGRCYVQGMDANFPKPTLELLLRIVEIFFLAELCALHLALLIVFIAWLAKHVIHELNGLRAEIRKWRADSPPLPQRTPRKFIHRPPLDPFCGSGMIFITVQDLSSKKGPDYTDVTGHARGSGELSTWPF